MNQKIIIGVVVVAVFVIAAGIYSASNNSSNNSTVSTNNQTSSSTSTDVKNDESTTTSTSTLTIGDKIQSVIKSVTNPTVPSSSLSNSRSVLAPEISTPDGFINTDGKPITLQGLRGKVVLVSFWTYSCINCQRTLPYLNDWYSKYKDQGLEIVGIHTPEFAYEKVQANVQNAVIKENINYPVVLDNDFSTWNAYGNQYWPRKYLVNKDGYIVYDHIGEGDYDVTEKAIQKALSEIK